MLNPALFLTLLAKGVAKPSIHNPQASKLLPGLEPRDTSYPILAIKLGRAVGLPRAGGELLHGVLVVQACRAGASSSPSAAWAPSTPSGRAGQTDVWRRPRAWASHGSHSAQPPPQAAGLGNGGLQPCTPL